MASPEREVIFFRGTSWPAQPSLAAASGAANLDNACMRIRFSWPGRQSVVYWIAILAFVLRVGSRLAQGIDRFWVNGYSLFFEMAQSIAAGKGIALANGVSTAFRVPLYPILLAGLTLGHRWVWPIVIAESLIGAATALYAALLARQMFGEAKGESAAVLAAVLTAVYPYYVVHDTALQETSLFTLLTLVAVTLALRAARAGAMAPAALCGLVLGLDVLARSPIAPFAVLVPLWLIARRRIAAGLLCGAAVVLTVTPWLIRNQLVAGGPVLTTEAGFELWNGNNDMLFRYYPMQSVDVSISAHIETLHAVGAKDLPAPGSSEVVVDRWFRQRALEYIRAHPWLTVANGFRKIGAAFDWLPTPRRSRAQTVLHALSFGPVMVLGLCGMWRRRAEWRDDSLIYLLFAQFLVVTAVYFGQTNHRVFLDVYLIVFTAGAVAARIGRSQTGPGSL